eukprot:gene631-2486_t
MPEDAPSAAKAGEDTMALLAEADSLDPAPAGRQGDRIKVDGEAVRAHPDGRAVSFFDGWTRAERSFEFDRVFSQYSLQEDVFREMAEDIVETLLSGTPSPALGNHTPDLPPLATLLVVRIPLPQPRPRRLPIGATMYSAGINGAVLTYGQTGSGKTHTMYGAPDGSSDGLIPRMVELLFRRLGPGGGNGPGSMAALSLPTNKVHVGLSLVQIYKVSTPYSCPHSSYTGTLEDPPHDPAQYPQSPTTPSMVPEKLMDLLTPEASNCSLREVSPLWLAPHTDEDGHDPSRGLWITDAANFHVRDVGEVMNLVHKGEASRAKANTRMNATSSRSHSILILTVSQIAYSDRSEKVSQLYLADLAGSECISKTGAEGERLEATRPIPTLRSVPACLAHPAAGHPGQPACEDYRALSQEAKSINVSLLALRNVIMSIVQGAPHVPYRDSKLTRLLQNSFGGNSRTALIVCCSPCADDRTETIAALRFGYCTRHITNKPSQNIHRSPEQMQQMIDETNAQIVAAQEQMRRLQRIADQAGIDIM